MSQGHYIEADVQFTTSMYVCSWHEKQPIVKDQEDNVWRHWRTIVKFGYVTYGIVFCRNKKKITLQGSDLCANLKIFSIKTSYGISWNHSLMPMVWALHFNTTTLDRRLSDPVYLQNPGINVMDWPSCPRDLNALACSWKTASQPS